MTGKIAVGIIIVSGPTADLQFSTQETQKVIAEVQNGLGWRAAQNPAANITWIYDIHSVQVNVNPGGGGDKEALWRDPAMVQPGYQGNWQGVIDYINHIKTQYDTDWTYFGYFTKYPLDHFAYASLGGPRLVMQYENDDWGARNTIFFSVSSDGQTWPSGQVINNADSTSAAPVACVFNNRLYLFLKAKGVIIVKLDNTGPWPPLISRS